MHLKSRCHPDSGVQAALYRGDLFIYCYACNTFVARLELANAVILKDAASTAVQ
jgi:hypothetical protein